MSMDRSTVEQLITAAAPLGLLGEDTLDLGLAETLPFANVVFERITPTNGEMVAVDGGNAELFSAPAVSLQLLRFGAVHWNGKLQRSSEEWLLLLTKGDGYRAVLTHRHGGREAFPQTTLAFSAAEPVLLDGGMRGNIGRLGTVVRKLGELQLAAKLQQRFSDSVLVLDGNLQVTSPMLERALGALAHPIGVAKTVDLFTAQGRTATAAVNQLAKQSYVEGCWVTSPLATLRSARDMDIHFAKLHPRSQHLFRIDCLGGWGRLSGAMAQLAAVSSDPVFFGYPYPLIVADQLARVSNEECAQLQAMLMARAGDRYSALRAAANALNAHAVLDRIR